MTYFVFRSSSTLSRLSIPGKKSSPSLSRPSVQGRGIYDAPDDFFPHPHFRTLIFPLPFFKHNSTIFRAFFWFCILFLYFIFDFLFPLPIFAILSPLIIFVSQLFPLFPLSFFFPPTHYVPYLVVYIRLVPDKTSSSTHRLVPSVLGQTFSTALQSVSGQTSSSAVPRSSTPVTSVPGKISSSKPVLIVPASTPLSSDVGLQDLLSPSPSSSYSASPPPSPLFSRPGPSSGILRESYDNMIEGSRKSRRKRTLKSKV